MMSLQEALTRHRPLLADGATGTMLQKTGLAPGQPPERATLDNPQAVQDLAFLYAQAGSDLVYTNTFGANRIRLARFGLSQQVRHLNFSAVALAREGVQQSGRAVFVVGSVGPTGELLEPFGDLSPKEAQDAFQEQCYFLMEAGVDGLVGETFTDLNEAVAFLRAAQQVACVPIFVSLSFERTGRTFLGSDPETAIQVLLNEGATAVGANCGEGIDPVRHAVRKMKACQPDALLLAKPNAGVPYAQGLEIRYPATPEQMADFAREMRQLSIAIVGGCCGTTPDHIRAMFHALSASDGQNTG